MNIIDGASYRISMIKNFNYQHLLYLSMNDMALHFERMRHLGKMDPLIDVRNDQQNIDN